jgi:hypothetical protein
MATKKRENGTAEIVVPIPPPVPQHDRPARAVRSLLDHYTYHHELATLYGKKLAGPATGYVLRHEVSWSMSEVQRVTLLACLQEAITYFWNRGGDPTAEDVANLVDYLRVNIMTRARNPVRSTDPMQVLCAQADLEAMADVIQLLESGLLRGP